MFPVYASHAADECHSQATLWACARSSPSSTATVTTAQLSRHPTHSSPRQAGGRCSSSTGPRPRTRTGSASVETPEHWAAGPTIPISRAARPGLGPPHRGPITYPDRLQHHSDCYPRLLYHSPLLDCSSPGLFVRVCSFDSTYIHRDPSSSLSTVFLILRSLISAVLVVSWVGCAFIMAYTVPG